jgi:hypothetical protein
LEEESSRLKGSGKAAGNMKMTYFVEGIQGMMHGIALEIIWGEGC